MVSPKSPDRAPNSFKWLQISLLWEDERNLKFKFKIFQKIPTTLKGSSAHEIYVQGKCFF